MMAKHQPPPKQGLMPSVIDRLIDPDTEGTAWRRGYDLSRIIDAVRRDLEELLNAHPSHHDLGEEWPQLRTSILAFGLPDLVSVSVSSATQRERIGRMVKTAVERFEPRLRDVEATLVENKDGDERHMRFHINAKLNVDPAPEVSFETVLELTTGHASIQLSETST